MKGKEKAKSKGFRPLLDAFGSQLQQNYSRLPNYLVTRYIQRAVRPNSINGAEGGSRTHTPRGRVILSHVRLPFRHFGKFACSTIISRGVANCQETVAVKKQLFLRE